MRKLGILFLLGFFIYGCKPSAQIASSKSDQANIQKIPTDAIDLVIANTIDSNVTIQEPAKSTIQSLKKDTLTIVGVGDIMLGTNFPDPNYLPPDSGKYLLKDVLPYLRQADLTFGNHEGVILNEGGNQKHCSNPKLCYLFRSPEFITQNLVNAGFDVMSLANNHAGDFGNPGRKNSMRVLDSLGIHHAGQLAKPYTVFTKEGITYGFAAFSPNTGTVSINDLENAREIVRRLDSLTDIVIISFHGGAEGRKFEHVTREREYFYGENRGNVYEFSHALIDEGADIIFGHGPHVARAIEVYKKRFIAYSLGNFCTYARFNLSGVNGLAPIAQIKTTNEGEFISGKIISAKQKGEGIPEIDPNFSAALRIKQLTEMDFPDSKIFIDETGNIHYIQSQ